MSGTYRHAVRKADPAFALLLQLCARAARHGAGASVAPAGRVEDWPAFLHLVDRHRVAGLVHLALGREAASVPDDVRQSIAQKAGGLARTNLAMVAAIIGLQKAFDAAGIGAVFFKGALVGQRAYGSVAVKHGKDIDFLVRPDDLAATFALLAGEGYQPVFPQAPLTPAKIDALRAFQIEAVMVDPACGVQLEPHWRLTENRRLLPLAPLLAGAGKRESLGGVAIRGFHPDDEFAYLCVHGVRSGWFRLKWLADLHALLAGLPEEERLRLYRHAERRGAGPAALLAFGLCREMFGLPVPAALARPVEAPLQKAMHRISVANLQDEYPQFSLRQVVVLPMLHALACGPGHVMAEVLRWTVNCQDALDVPLPRRLYFLYPLLRAPLWFGRLLRGTTRLGRRTVRV
ncbi:nucleotidyltransferase family protein [Ancylobacter sp. FA202]|uniref:nucleotidyltransferase domain-containing protein n=1 Tax=Ancylobacter sp. FA202 TaxID=1111106 RepID=UPI001FD9C40F|nr:nucleotidyltransferase family protein [Ancylobacter sp. FA202]